MLSVYECPSARESIMISFRLPLIPCPFRCAALFHGHHFQRGHHVRDSVHVAPCFHFAISSCHRVSVCFWPSHLAFTFCAPFSFHLLPCLHTSPHPPLNDHPSSLPPFLPSSLLPSPFLLLSSFLAVRLPCFRPFPFFPPLPLSPFFLVFFILSLFPPFLFLFLFLLLLLPSPSPSPTPLHSSLQFRMTGIDELGVH